jgi:predicted Fe-Mo cluster-binding NifX family protein
MKIAVASADGATLSPHFGRSRCFLVFTVEDGKIAGPEVRDNTFTAHAQGQCAGGEEHHHDQPHSHAGIVAALRDCEVVLCGGMGWRAAEDLKANGIRPVSLAAAGPAKDAVEAFLSGKAEISAGFCRCHG